jgi:two-component system sensor histidine kinase/response regulator
MLTKLINAGITEEMNIVSVKRIKTFNLTSIIGIIIALIYLFINVFRERYFLASIDLLYIISLSILIYCHFNQLFNIGFIYTTIALAVGFSISSIFYRDSMEFFLLLIITMNLVFKTGKKNAVWAIILYSILFSAIVIFNLTTPTLYQDLGEKIRTENIIIWICLQGIFLNYFGTLNDLHHNEIENKNTLLINQQKLLVEKSLELEKINYQLQELNEAKEKIFSIIAHDIRAPIAALKGSLELLYNNILSKEDIEKIAKELSIKIGQLKDNLDILLEWSKSQMYGIEVNATRVELKPLILNSLNLLIPSIELKKIKIQLSVDEHLFVYADPNHIRLVLRNLIANAIKYSYTEKEIKISAVLNENNVAISVQDYGVGMDEKVLQMLFHSISVNSTYGTLNERGTGLGLLLCKEFLDKNNGSISVKSQKGKGTIFTFTIPASIR